MKITTQVPINLKVKKTAGGELEQASLAAGQTIEAAELVAYMVHKGSTWVRPAGLSGDQEFRSLPGGGTHLFPGTPAPPDQATAPAEPTPAAEPTS
jgi:hypothetical protein